MSPQDIENSIFILQVYMILMSNIISVMHPETS